MRTYAENCAIAKSLDVIGDRWTLLLIRELALRGPCRYTDLRNGLPGIATNLLAQRLRELEDAGVVRREEAPPPIATTLFALTERGEQLRPTLEALTRWGLPLMGEQRPDDAVRSHWLASAIGGMLVDREPHGPPVTVELHVGDQPIVIETRDGAIHTSLGQSARPDAVLTGAARPVLGVLRGSIALDEARANGVTLEGERSAVRRILFAPPAADGAAA